MTVTNFTYAIPFNWSIQFTDFQLVSSYYVWKTELITSGIMINWWNNGIYSYLKIFRKTQENVLNNIFVIKIAKYEISFFLSYVLPYLP